MKRFSTAITIRARPEIIWALLTDAPNYPHWNSTVEKIDGTIAANGRVTVHAKSAPGRAFPLKVLRALAAHGVGGRRRLVSSLARGVFH